MGGVADCGSQREAELDRFRAAKKGFPEPLLNLLVRLKDLSLEAGFRQVDAAALVDHAGSGPKLHYEDPAGKMCVSKKLVSAQLSPRDRLTPPCAELIDAYVSLYVLRTGAARAPLNRELTALYKAAVTNMETEKRCRSTAALKNGRRSPTYAQVRELEHTISGLRADAGHRDADLAQLRKQNSELQETAHGQQRRIDALTAELAQSRELLAAADSKFSRIWTALLRSQAEADQIRKKLQQTTATATFRSDQQQARIWELEHAEAPRTEKVRQRPDADPAAAGRHGRPSKDSIFRVLGELLFALLVRVLAGPESRPRQTRAQKRARRRILQQLGAAGSPLQPAPRTPRRPGTRNMPGLSFSSCPRVLPTEPPDSFRLPAHSGWPAASQTQQQRGKHAPDPVE